MKIKFRIFCGETIKQWEILNGLHPVQQFELAKKQIETMRYVKNLEFNLEMSDIIIPKVCPILEVNLVIGTKGNYEFSPSLDRIDNTLGYSRGNIKFSTKTEQVENQNLRIDNKSGYKGVCYHKLNKKYSATITINKSKVFLGYYDTALEAALVYDNYVLKNNLNRKTNL